MVTIVKKPGDSKDVMIRRFIQANRDLPELIKKFYIKPSQILKEKKKLQGKYKRRRRHN